MDQTITGLLAIASVEQLFTVDAHIIQTLIVGSAPIPSGEYFEPPSGVSIDPLTVPTSISISF